MCETAKSSTSRHGKKFDDWWEDRRLGEKVAVGIGFGILGLGFIALLGLVTMALWNWLMPVIFNLPQIDYWQTWGLLILSFILFKSWGGSGESRRTDKKRRRELRRFVRQERPPENETETESTNA